MGAATSASYMIQLLVVCYYLIRKNSTMQKQRIYVPFSIRKPDVSVSNRIELVQRSFGARERKTGVMVSWTIYMFARQPKTSTDG